MYNPKSPYVIYCEACYISDAWSFSEYAQDYDESRPFLEQLDDLLKRVPKAATFIDHAKPSVNSEYMNYAGGNKNCYLIFNSAENEDSIYSRGIRWCHDVADIYFGQKAERCYEDINIAQSTGVRYGQNVSGCLNSLFVINGSGLQNCVGCANLRHKSYYWLNEELPENEWKRRLEELRGSYKAIKDFEKEFEKISLLHPRKENSNLKTSSCTGDYIFESKNCQNCFETADSENCKYAYAIKAVKDSYDVLGFGYGSELLLECVGVGGSQNIKSSYWVENSHHCEYCFSAVSSENCFGCDGVKHAQYSILNKRYSPEEYSRLRGTIITELKSAGEYGLFFPLSLAPFAYNESIAQDNFPLSKENAIQSGFRWEDDIQLTKGKETMSPDQIPDHIKDIPDSITNEILVCISCGRNYRITAQELSFYRREIIPLPRQCFICRHRARVSRRGPMQLFDRNCARCSTTIHTTYAPDRKEIIYCETCYNAEVV